MEMYLRLIVIVGLLIVVKNLVGGKNIPLMQILSVVILGGLVIGQLTLIFEDNSSAIAQESIDGYHDAFGNSVREDVALDQSAGNEGQQFARVDSGGVGDVYHQQYRGEPEDAKNKGQKEAKQGFRNSSPSPYYTIQEGNGVVLVTVKRFPRGGGYADVLFMGLQEVNKNEKWVVLSWQLITTYVSGHGCSETTHILVTVREKFSY